MAAADAGTTPETIKAEAKHVADLVDHGHYKEASHALRDDSHLDPAHLKSFYAELKTEEQKGHHLHPLVIADTEGGGVKVSVKGGHDKDRTLFEQKPVAQDAADKPVPPIGKMLESQGLTPAMGDHIQDIQKHKVQITPEEQAKIDAYKTAHGGKEPKFFGEYAVALYGDQTKVTDQSVKDALDQQKHLFEEKARAIVENSTRTLPIQAGEGPYQYLKRVHPKMHNVEAKKLAVMIRDLHSGVIKEGERLDTLPPAEIDTRVADTVKDLRNPKKRDEEVEREREKS